MKADSSSNIKNQGAEADISDGFDNDRGCSNRAHTQTMKFLADTSEKARRSNKKRDLSQTQRADKSEDQFDGVQSTHTVATKSKRQTTKVMNSELSLAFGETQSNSRLIQSADG